MSVHKNACKISQNGYVTIAKLTGAFRNIVLSRSEYPAVGDWVYVNDGGLIESVKIRNNQLSRKLPGKKYEEQVIAANIDIMFIVSSLNKEFNINKIGRYIILAETNHIKPVILLTKLDVCNNPDSYREKVQLYYPNSEIITVSSITGVGIEAISSKMESGSTSVFVGASGVGKSTLVNNLLTRELMKTCLIRENDDKGRHTTTHRELFELSNGAYIIDTPGIREIGLWINDENLMEFQDIVLIGRACKYRNCSHINEIDCAVKRAVENGDLSKERYKNYIKTTREIYYSMLCQNEGERLRFKNKVKQMSKNERYH